MPQFFSPLPVPFLSIRSSCLLLSICRTAFLRPPPQWRSADGVPVPGLAFRMSLDLLGRLPVPVTRAMGSLSVPAGLPLCSGWHMFGTSAATSHQPAAITLYSPHILLLLLHFPVCWSLRMLECLRTDRVCGCILLLRLLN